MASLLAYLQNVSQHPRFKRFSLFGAGSVHQLSSDEQEAATLCSDAAVKAFKLQSLADLQIVLSAMILSECVYKMVDMGELESSQAATYFVNEFPSGFAPLRHMQGAAQAAHHRYMLGSDDTSLYVVFMGTKHVRDVVADANLLQAAVWQDGELQTDALAHRGFLARSRRIPVEALFGHARRHGKRLVLCGHSLGGAVALLCTLRLLRSLREPSPLVQCICFGTPAIGNAALAAMVHEHGWEDHILNFILPEDMVPRMLALPATAPSKSASADLQQGSASSQQGRQSLLSIPQQQLHRLKNVLMGNKSDQQQNLDPPPQPAEQQSQQQQLQLDPDKQQTVEAQRNHLSRLSGTLQNLQARLKASTQHQQQLLTQAPVDAQQDLAQVQDNSQESVLKQSDQQHEHAPADTDVGTRLYPTESETRLQKLARLAWRRSPALDAAVVQHGSNGKNLQPNMDDSSTAVSAVQHASNTTKAGAANDNTGKSAALSDRGSNAAVASPGVEDRGIALDAAIKEPVSFLRSFSQKLHVFDRQTLSAGNARSAVLHKDLEGQVSHEQTTTGTITQRANTAQPVAQPSGAVTHAQQASQQAGTTTLPAPASLQPLSTWQRLSSQLGLQISSAMQGAGSRVRAVQALLPSYPMYVHIGSHQILLPASPALTEAVQSAEQQGPTEQQRQALLMHSMAAYRGRALAICRSALQWQVSSEANEVTVSSDLAPPLDISQASSTLPPLPLLLSAADSKPETGSNKPTVPSLNVLKPEIVTKQPARLSGDVPKPEVVPKQPAFAPHGIVQSSHNQRQWPVVAERVQVKSQLLPWSSKQQTQKQQALLQPQQHARENSAKSTSEESTSPGAVQQGAMLVQQGHDRSLQGGVAQSLQPNTQQQGSAATPAQPGRWLSPASFGWPAQRSSKDSATLRVQIQLHGSAHGIPVTGQLQVLGQGWCKAKLVSSSGSNSTPGSLTTPSGSISAAATQSESLTGHAWRRLIWKAADQSQADDKPWPDVMRWEAEVPITVLQKLVDRLEEHRVESAGNVDTSGQQLQVGCPRDEQKPELMQLRLQTDFVTQQHAVQARLPVVWVLGPEPVYCQSVWRGLTQLDEPSSAELKDEDSTNRELEGLSQPFSQRLKQRLGKLKLSGRDTAAQQASVPSVCVVRAGVQYVHVKSAGVPFLDVLFCVHFVMLQMLQQGMQRQFASLAARVRAVYHRHQLQQLQDRLQQTGPPSAIIFVVGSLVDDKVAAGLGNFAKEASKHNLAVLGVANGGTRSLHSSAVEQWVMLSSDIDDRSTAHFAGLRQQLHAAVYLRMNSLLQAKL